MKCCCSHDVTGIFLGCIYMIASAIAFACLLFSFIETELRKDPEIRKFLSLEECEILLGFGGVSFISYLFTVAIEKRQRYLILPWLFLGLYAFYKTLKKFVLFLGHLAVIYSLDKFVIVVFTLIFAIEIIVIYNSCYLFMRMRKEHIKEIEKFEQLLHYRV